MNHLSYEHEENMTSVTAALMWDLDPFPFEIYGFFRFPDSLSII